METNIKYELGYGKEDFFWNILGFSRVGDIGNISLFVYNGVYLFFTF